MKIAFDLDDTLAEFQLQWIAFNNDRYKTNLRFTDLFTYDYTVTMNISMEEMSKRISEIYSSQYMDAITPDPYAIKVVDELKNRGHELILITARDLSVAHKTRYWIEKHFPARFSEIILTGEVVKKYNAKKSTKGDVCFEKEVDILIDDAPMYIEQVLDKNIRAIMPIKPWNSSFNADSNILFNRVENLGEILDLIPKLS